MLEWLALSYAGSQVALEMGKLMNTASPLALTTYYDFPHSVRSSRPIHHRRFGDLVVPRSHQALPSVSSSVYAGFCRTHSLLRPYS